MGENAYQSGLVALIGRTNVGKSTLLNALVDEKLAIVSPKPQTTRHAIQGVVNRPEAQIVFVDTPGFFRTHRSSLVERLHTRARSALEGIDLVLHVVDPSRPIGDEDRMVLEELQKLQQPRLLCLNKADLRRRPHRADWMERASGYAGCVEVSAIARRGLDTLIAAITPLLPSGPPLYGQGEKTNAHIEFRIGEIIREKIYLLTDEEVPYRTAVRVDEWHPSEGESVPSIRATILVAGDRYKAMLIGAQGRMIRSIRTAARKDLAQLLGARVSLEITVRVDARLDGA